MANLPVSENPKFTSEIEKFEKSDPQHADEFNSRMTVLFENELALERDKAQKSQKYDKVLIASNWTGSDAPFEILIECDGVTETNNIEVIPDILTIEQWESLNDAGITNGTQENGKIKLFAYGNKPVVDIPIILIIRGD